jgi:molybdate transport system substrate-binding protein
VIGAKGVPIGDYTRTVLANLDETAALRNVVSNETDVKGVVAKIALGEADAGFVYVTDVKPVAGKVNAIALPARAQAKVEYEIAIVKASAQQAAARSFVSRVLGPDGRRQLAEAGFGPP